MIYQRTFKVFHDYKLSDYLGGITNHIQSLIGNKSEDYILNVNETEYINSLVDEYTVTPININFEKMFITDYEKKIPAEDFPRDIIVHEGKSSPRQAIVYHLPYTGNQYLLECSATHQYLMWTTEVFLDNQLKCYRLFRPKFSKVKTSFVAQIRQVSNTLTPSAGVCDYTPV